VEESQTGMNSKRRDRRSSTPRSADLGSTEATVQRELWSDQPDNTPSSSTNHASAEPCSLLPEAPTTSAAKSGDRKAIQDLLFVEGLLAARLSRKADSLEALQGQLIRHLPQNSLETRTRYAQSLLKWFFPEGLSSLLPRVAAAYADEAITSDVLRCCYLMAEPIVGACVTECLFPLETGMRVPAHYLERFLREHLGTELPARTAKRLKTNLMHLGFLGRSRGQPDQLLPVNPTPTATLVLIHYLFAPSGPRTVELRHLLAHPFWKYLGYKAEDGVRAVLRAADVAGLVGKYVVADQLEQVTTCFSFDELLSRRARL
jgi:hypothetical protein